MEIITYRDAKRRGLTRYYTGHPCPQGHVAGRFSSNGTCVECNRARAHAWQAAHPEKNRARAHAWYAAHLEDARARSRAWNAANPDWAAALAALRHARERYPDCVPPNFNLDATIPFYAEARRLTRETGTPHEVDHVYALCLGGKHIAANLQVITAAANRAKAQAERGNK